jgi:hypothetical protein
MYDQLEKAEELNKSERYSAQLKGERIISLTPILEIKGNCPLRGLAADSKLTVDKFLAMTHDEKELR